VIAPDLLRPEGLAWVDGFLSGDECAAMLHELRYAYWTASTVVNRDGDVLRSGPSEVRTSETADAYWFTDELAVLMAAFEARLRDAFGIDAAYLEEWQATRYAPGGRFEPHYDAGFWSDGPGGERTGTVLLYLDAPEAGGGTEFPCFDTVVEPRPGRVLVWNNLRPDGRVDRLMRHAALPVERGRKTTLVTWGHERPVRQPERQTA
jgi:hypothetical protein